MGVIVSPRSPSLDWGPLTRRDRRRRAEPGLTPDEVRRLFTAADETSIGRFVRVAVLTGLRRGELLGLLRAHIDLERGVLSVQQTAQRISCRGVVFRQPKTRLSRRVVADAGVGHVRWHDLRHAHATLLLRQGIHPKVVSERLGHASAGITLDTYSHVLPGLQATAAAALDEALADPGIAEAR